MPCRAVGREGVLLCAGLHVCSLWCLCGCSTLLGCWQAVHVRAGGDFPTSHGAAPDSDGHLSNYRVVGHVSSAGGHAALTGGCVPLPSRYCWRSISNHSTLTPLTPLDRST